MKLTFAWAQPISRDFENCNETTPHKNQIAVYSSNISTIVGYVGYRLIRFALIFFTQPMGILWPFPIIDARNVIWNLKNLRNGIAQKEGISQKRSRLIDSFLHINKVTFNINCFLFVYFRTVGVFILSQNENSPE